MPAGDGGAGGDSGVMPTPVVVDSGNFHTFAVVGNYGVCGADDSGADGSASATCPHEKAIAAMVHSWVPEAVFTTGDNDNGPGDGTEVPGDQHPYDDLIDAGAFFPSWGNVDWSGSMDAALAYFRIVPDPPYYSKDFDGILSAYFVDTNPQDPVGDDGGSLQAEWLGTHVASSTSPWKLVFTHHPPYSSCAGSYNGTGGLEDYTWVAAAGVNAVFNGHLHGYERLAEPGATDASIPFLVMGASGISLVADCDASIPGSLKRVYGSFGAIKLQLTDKTLTASFYDETGAMLDTVTLQH